MMKTVNEVSRLTGVSIRTLHYYHTIGLLHPSSITDAGYRLYDDTALERLQQILLFRELEFPLREIRTILESSVAVGGYFLGGPIGLGTIIIALTLGPSIQWAFRLRNERPEDIQHLSFFKSSVKPLAKASNE